MSWSNKSVVLKRVNGGGGVGVDFLNPLLLGLVLLAVLDMLLLPRDSFLLLDVLALLFETFLLLKDPMLFRLLLAVLLVVVLALDLFSWKFWLLDVIISDCCLD